LKALLVGANKVDSSLGFCNTWSNPTASDAAMNVLNWSCRSSRRSHMVGGNAGGNVTAGADVGVSTTGLAVVGATDGTSDAAGLGLGFVVAELEEGEYVTGTGTVVGVETGDFVGVGMGPNESTVNNRLSHNVLSSKKRLLKTSSASAVSRTCFRRYFLSSLSSSLIT
jgi:hypothetical protein